jgi:hypothetical protein
MNMQKSVFRVPDPDSVGSGDPKSGLGLRIQQAAVFYQNEKNEEI